ncbi:hypothetical protein HDV06_004564 [Boothiomyces sp. JEL0866]|nr:hypothetical protein HDV06_004564 [Boothiomyces sp. JEL0866]
MKSVKRMFSIGMALLHENPLGIPNKLPVRNVERMQRGLPKKQKIPGIKDIILVSSAKGGVGKSTTAVNIAVAMSNAGLKVGLLDADIFGPSIPKMMNLEGLEPLLSDKNKLVPLNNHGISCMSIGFLVKEDAPVVWRGMMVMKSIQQLLWDVDWSNLDFLVIDLPPGTGDVQLTIQQQVEISGAVIVSTPQDVALIDTVKGINMFRKMDTKILGIVQNMSYFQCESCNHQTHIFGDGLIKKAQEMEINILGSIPLNAAVCKSGDSGKPICLTHDMYKSAYQNAQYSGAYSLFPVKELIGKRLRLTPLNVETDTQRLFEIQNSNPNLFEFMPFGHFDDYDKFKAFLKVILDKPSSLLYVMKEIDSGTIVGMEGYLNIVPEHKVMEVGYIFVDPAYQGKGYGLEASILLIEHAFNLGQYRVEWKTHHLNIPSQRLALKLGYTHEAAYESMLSLLILAANVQSQSCTNPVKHVEWRELTSQQQTNYANAVKCLLAKPSKMSRLLRINSALEDLAYVHNQDSANIHNTAQFFVWHRALMQIYASTLKDRCGYTDPVPYWDWSADSQAPDASSIWNTFGKASNYNGNCFADGAFANMVVQFTDQHCVTRGFASASASTSDLGRTSGAIFGAMYSPEQIAPIMNYPDFASFHGWMEGLPHNNIHMGIGGEMGNPAVSPNDPIFYMHHGNLDRLYYQWQNMDPVNRMYQYSGGNGPSYPNNPTGSVSDILFFYGLIPDCYVLDFIDLSLGGANGLACATYSNSITVAQAATSSASKRSKYYGSAGKVTDKETPDAFDRQHAYNLRYPNPASDEFLKKWKYTDEDIKKIHQMEEYIRNYTDHLNSLPLEYPGRLGRTKKITVDGDKVEVHDVKWQSKSQAEYKSEQALLKALVNSYNKAPPRAHTHDKGYH